MCPVEHWSAEFFARTSWISELIQSPSGTVIIKAILRRQEHSLPQKAHITDDTCLTIQYNCNLLSSVQGCDLSCMLQPHYLLSVLLAVPPIRTVCYFVILWNLNTSKVTASFQRDLCQWNQNTSAGGGWCMGCVGGGASGINMWQIKNASEIRELLRASLVSVICWCTKHNVHIVRLWFENNRPATSLQPHWVINSFTA